MTTIPMTPRMKLALRALETGEDLAFERTCVGRPTKQRLAKYGLAEYLTPKDWDGPMRLTPKGSRFLRRMT